MVPVPCSRFAAAPYPGEIPEGPYAVHAGNVHRIDVGADAAEGLGSLRAWLFAGDAGYVPTLAYGSNACPGRLAEKFASLGHELFDRIVAIPVRVTGVRRAWSASRTRAGILPYTLAQAPASDSMGAHLVMIPAALVPTMDRTEGRGALYAAARLTDATVELPDRTLWTRPLTYLGRGRRGPLTYDGRVLTPKDCDAVTAGQVSDASDARGADDQLPRYEEVPADAHLLEHVDPGKTDAAVFQYLTHGH